MYESWSTAACCLALVVSRGDVDVCGENGEFHTFAFKGPIFSKEIKYKTAEKVFKEYKAPENINDSCVSDTTKLSGFWYCDLLTND